MICNGERIGGALSASKVSENVTQHSVGSYNCYSIVTAKGKYVIGGVPQPLGSEYIKQAQDATAIILLTSKPEFCGGVGDVIAKNPESKVYATPAGLRNIKEIINTDVNECVIKDLSQLDGIQFVTAPTLPWVDTGLAMYDGVLFSGELFSGDEKYYKSRLAVNPTFVVSAVERVKEISPQKICPAVGSVCDIDKVINEYESYTIQDIREKPLVSIIYSSEYGFTKSLAEYAKTKLDKSVDVYFSSAAEADKSVVDKSDALIIGTNTINRNAPKPVWDIITSLDLVNKRQMPYFVFGSFGWAGDGIKLIDKTLQAMGMKQVSKPVQTLFAPAEQDFNQLEKAILKLISALNCE